MEISTEKTSEVRRKVRITIPKEQVKRAWRKVLRKVSSQARIPGFRPGKAPARLLERRFGKVIRDEVLDALLAPAITGALEEQSFEVLGQPEVHEIGELSSDAPLTVVFSVEVLPEVHVSMPEKADVIEIDRVVPDEEDHRQAIEALRDAHAAMRDVDGPAELGDDLMVELSLQPSVALGTEEAELESRHVHLDPGPRDAWLKEVVRGRHVGDILQADVELPEDVDHELAGRPCRLQGRVLWIKRRHVPETDEALAAAAGHDDVEALHAAVRADVERQAARQERGLRHRAALRWLMERSPVPAPSALVESEIDGRLIRALGGLDVRDTPRLRERLKPLRENFKPDAIRAVSEGLMLRHLIMDRGGEVTPEEVDDRIDELAAEMPAHVDRLREHYQREEARRGLEGQILEARVLEAVLEAATTVEGRTLTLRDPAEPPAPKEGGEAPAEGAGEAPAEGLEAGRDAAEGGASPDAPDAAPEEAAPQGEVPEVAPVAGD